MKPLVFAFDAQSGVNAGDVRVLGDRNGIRKSTHYP